MNQSLCVSGCLGAEERVKERQAVCTPTAHRTVTVPAHRSWSDRQGGMGTAGQGRDHLLQKPWNHAKHLINEII